MKLPTIKDYWKKIQPMIMKFKNLQRKLTKLIQKSVSKEACKER